MGIQNQDGALFMATGIDNSGLYKGKQEAMGIIRSMASEVTSFDIFAGIGTSAAIAFAQAAKSSYDFAKEYQKSMKEVATISSEISNNLSAYQQSLIDLTTEVPISANESAKALYGIVSAGYDGANGLKMLEISAKAAVGGVTDTATAADGMTSIMNAYRISMDKAEEVSDQLFTTVRLGKTTFGEISASISQAAPTAAAFGVELDQMLAALATITKTGTPTAQAMTQIRAAIQGTTKVLGDGAFEGRTFQEALQLLYDQAGGSATKLKEMLGTDEALAAVLKITGDNAKGAAADLQAVGDSAGASEEAFRKMTDTADSQLKLLTNNITAALVPMGTETLKKVQDVAQALNESFANGDIEKSIQRIEDLVLISASAWGSYKVAVLAAAVAENMRYQATLAHMAGMTKMQVIIDVVKTKTVALNALLMKNPYAIAVAGIVALGVALYRMAKNSSDATSEIKRNTADMVAKEKTQLDMLLTIARDETVAKEKRLEAVKKLNSISPEYLGNLTLENINTQKATTSIESYTKALEANARAKAVADKLAKIEAKKIENKVAIEDARRYKDSKPGNKTVENAYNIGVERIKKENVELDKQAEMYKKIGVEAAKASIKNEDSKYNKGGSNTVGDSDVLKNIRITAELALNAERLAIMEDGRKKRLLLSEQEHAEKKATLDREYKETVEAYKKAGSVTPESVTTTYNARIVENDNSKTKRDSLIEKESNKEFAEMQRSLTEVYLTEEGKRLAVIKDRYDKQREWAKQQFDGGNMDEGQYSSFIGKVDAAQSHENLQSLLEQYRDWSDKRLQIENDFNDQLNTLESGRNDNNSAQIDKATKQLQESKNKALSQLSLDELKDGDLWTKMFSDLNKLATGTLENILAKAKTVNTSAWNPEQVKEYEDAIQRLTDVIESRNPFKSIQNNWNKMMEGIKSGNKDNIATGLDGISSAVDKINGDLNTIAVGIGNVFGDEAGYAAGQVVILTSALTGFSKAASDISKGDIIGGIASIVSSIGSVFTIGRKVKEMNKAAREENQKFYDEAKKGELEYQMLIRERLRLEQQIGESMMGYNKRITEELEKQKKANADSFNEKWNKLQGESYISGKGYQHGTWFRKAKTWNEYDSLAGKSYDDIEKLYMEGKLDGKAKELFEELQRLKDEGVDIDKMMAENAEAFNEYVSGMSFDGAKDSLKSFLLSTNGDIKNLANNFEDAMRNAIVNMIIDNVMGDRIEKWYSDFAEFMKNKDSMTDEEREKRKEELQNEWTQIGKDSQAAKDDAFDAAGITDKKTQSATSGGGMTMSQDTGNELNGRFTALQITGEEIKKQVMTQTDIQQQTLNHIVKLAVCPEYMSEVRDITLEMNDKMDVAVKHLSELPKQTVLLESMNKKLDRL